MSTLLHHLSDRALARKPSYFWENVPKVENPHPAPIQLIGGLPNYKFFPVTSSDVHLRTTPFQDSTPENTFTAIDVITTDSNINDKLDFKSALQYSSQDGFDVLRDQIRNFVKRVVKPNYENWNVVCTLGGADGISKSFDILINPGDTVLFEEFTFTPVLNSLNERGGIAIPIKLENIFKNNEFDYYDELKYLLENWEILKPNLKRPKVLYTIPNGHNPLGLAQSLNHKKKIYQLAELYDFIILEDEPYSYLNFDKFDNLNTNFNLTNDEFINSLNPSYMTIDNSNGRVIRVETFSKIYAPGMRLGYIVCHENFIPHFSHAAEVISRSPSGLSQIYLNNTIIHLGGIEGWIHWITQVRNEYLKRKNIYVSTLINSNSFKKGYLKPIDPNCGMFVSIIINIEKHSKFNGNNYNELMDLFYIKSVENGVMVVLGRNMSVDKEFSLKRSNFLRTAICFTDTHEILQEAAKRIDISVIKFFEDSI
jgi:aromatic amino acid aminotransferase II